jgi:hypothetical protein
MLDIMVRWFLIVYFFPQAMLRSPAVMKIRLFKPVIILLSLSPKGLIFITAGERSVTCGNLDDEEMLPEKAGLFNL